MYVIYIYIYIYIHIYVHIKNIKNCSYKIFFIILFYNSLTVKRNGNALAKKTRHFFKL